MTLTEFLDARIGEDEVEARRAFDDLDLDGTGTGWSTVLGYEHNQLSAPGYVFTRRWSPERVLAECEAKRRIVGTGEFPTHPMRCLAAVYADHADYRPEWKP